MCAIFVVVGIPIGIDGANWKNPEHDYWTPLMIAAYNNNDGSCVVVLCMFLFDRWCALTVIISFFVVLCPYPQVQLNFYWTPVEIMIPHCGTLPIVLVKRPCTSSHTARILLTAAIKVKRLPIYWRDMLTSLLEAKKIPWPCCIPKFHLD